MDRKIVLVSGSPASGKSTLAAPLSHELGFPLLGKDEIKETLHDALGGGETDISWSRKLGAAAMGLMWTMAARCPEVVLEANFWTESRTSIESLGGDVVEVFCACPPTVAAQRYAQRFASTHPVHVLAVVSPETMADYRPLGLGPVVKVDTTQPVDVPSIAAAVEAAFPLRDRRLLVRRRRN